MLPIASANAATQTNGPPYASSRASGYPGVDFLEIVADTGGLEAESWEQSADAATGSLSVRADASQTAPAGVWGLVTSAMAVSEATFSTVFPVLPGRVVLRAHFSGLEAGVRYSSLVPLFVQTVHWGTSEINADFFTEYLHCDALGACSNAGSSGHTYGKIFDCGPQVGGCHRTLTGDMVKTDEMVVPAGANAIRPNVGLAARVIAAGEGSGRAEATGILASIEVVQP